MKAISLDLRGRILTAYDRGDVTREGVARRFEVSLGMVKKLLQQRRHTGEIGPRHYRSGRKPLFMDFHRQRLQELLTQKPDLTLAELRTKLSIQCSLPAIHYVLDAMGLTYKKRHSVLRSRTGRTSSLRVAGGSVVKGTSTPPSLSLSTNRRPRRT